MAEPVTGDDDYGFNSQLALVNAVTPLSHFFSDFDYSPVIHSAPRFSVPDSWTVQKVPRPTGIRVDRYYIEPETGRKFRSRNEVMRYLNDEDDQTTGFRPLKLGYTNKISSTDRRMITSGGTMTPVRNWSYTKFSLPEDWFVEKVPRKSGRAIDKYYHDPETGRKFRSLRDVERYLTKGLTPRSRSAPRLKYHEKSLQRCASKRKIVSGGKMLDLNDDEDKDNLFQLVNVTPTSYRSLFSLNLPDGWIVEYVPRRSSDHIDRYYYEPGTGQKFRSLSAVRKHLAELDENSPLSVVLEDLKEKSLPLSKAFKLSTCKKNHDSRKKRVSKTDQASSLNNRPSKINWVMSSSGGESWNAFVDDSLVPDRLQQQWGRRFMFDINNNNQNASISG